MNSDLKNIVIAAFEYPEIYEDWAAFNKRKKFFLLEKRKKFELNENYINDRVTEKPHPTNNTDEEILRNDILFDFKSRAAIFEKRMKKGRVGKYQQDHNRSRRRAG